MKYDSIYRGAFLFCLVASEYGW